MTITRRDFLRSGAATLLVGAQACVRDEGDSLANGQPIDTCIVGSGFAGTVLAQRLTEAGSRTVVLEAGGDATLRPLRDVNQAFGFTNSGEIPYALHASRVMAIGGGSNHWAGNVNRLQPTDFAVRTRFGLYADWPITYAELEPYYCAAEDWLWTEGYPPVPGAEPVRSCAYPQEASEPYAPPAVSVNGVPQRYFHVARSNRDSRPVRLAEREIPALRKTDRGTLLAGQQAIRLVTLDGKTIDHVVLRSAGGKTQELRAKRFIIAAGAVETPRLLLLSRSEWHPDGLGNGSDLVGRHFSDHPTIKWTFHSKRADDLIPKSRLHRHDRTHDYYDAFRRRDLNACHFSLRRTPSGAIDLKMQPAMEPQAKNRITLSSSAADEFGSPLPDIDFGFSKRDRRTLTAGRDVLNSQAAALGADRRDVTESLVWRWHSSGTCRMGFTASDGVVDTNGRVFGTDNLFATGASVFPTAGTANPTDTIVALALRLADHLLALSV